MAITQRLEVRQSQQLVMTPQLQQAIKLLQLSNLELAAYVEQEVERNPLLEAGEDRPETLRAETGGIDAPEAAPSAEPALLATDRALKNDAAPPDAGGSLDTGLDNIYADESVADRANERAAAAGPSDSGWANLRPTAGGFDDDESSLEGRLGRDVSLREHLAEQLHVAIKCPMRRAIGLHLIGLIDEAGYLIADLVEVADKLGAPLAAVDETLAVLQRFEPAGVAARSLAECLALQLRDRDRLDPAMQTMLDHLELVARRDIAGLSRACGVDAEDVADMIAEIKRLTPKPGLAFGAEPVQRAVPDVYVRETAQGGYTVELNTDTLPRVLVNQRYYAQISGKAATKEAKTYLTECLQNANWLAKSLDQRAKTILKVATEIVRQQDGFFVRGIQHLRPLNLRMVAEAIGMHESTVSRVTANKYMATPRGLFELKFFFTSAIQAADGGEAHSAEAVRHRIKELIEAENCEGVLSDDQIVSALASAGIDIARRTVAKYREAMRIPSSVERRRLKKAGA